MGSGLGCFLVWAPAAGSPKMDDQRLTIEYGAVCTDSTGCGREPNDDNRCLLVCKARK